MGRLLLDGAAMRLLMHLSVREEVTICLAYLSGQLKLCAMKCERRGGQDTKQIKPVATAHRRAHSQRHECASIHTHTHTHTHTRT